jgi:hypothetical protein
MQLLILCAGMVEVLALQIDFGAAEMVGQPLREP